MLQIPPYFDHQKSPHCQLLFPSVSMPGQHQPGIFALTENQVQNGAMCNEARSVLKNLRINDWIGVIIHDRFG